MRTAVATPAVSVEHLARSAEFAARAEQARAASAVEILAAARSGHDPGTSICDVGRCSACRTNSFAQG